MNKFKKVSFICLLLVFLISFTVMAGDSLETLLSGIENYYQEDYEEAFKILNIDIDREDIPQKLKVNILYYRTLSQIELFKIVEAKDTVSKLKDMGYEFAYIYRKLGEIYLNKKGQFDMPFYNEARKNLEKANKLGINSFALHNDLALSYQGSGNLNKAIKEYELILNKDENAVDFINLASLYKNNGDNQNALKFYKKALENGCEKVSLYINLGDLYINNKDYKKAINVLKKGIKIENNFVALHYKLARAYYLNNDYNNAKSKFNKVTELNQNYYQAYYYLGEIYNSEENWQHSIYNYEQAIKFNPDFADAYIALGNIYLEQENYYKAIASFTSAIEKNETYPEGHYRLAVTYYKLNMKEAAIKELRTTLHLNKEYREARELLDKLLEE